MHGAFISFTKFLNLHFVKSWITFQQEGRYIVSENLKLDLKIERYLSHLRHIYKIHNWHKKSRQQNLSILLLLIDNVPSALKYQPLKGEIMKRV